MLNIGSVLEEKYEVIKVLGKGGMGTVYLCKNMRLGNFWAIKEIKKDNNINIDILSEPNILKKLNHHGIPRIVDIFYKDNNLYMVEDYIEGKTLKQYVEKTGTITTKEACNIVLSICDIISYLHSFNPPIIYRDLKPSNIMITPSGKVVLIDFGISKTYRADKAVDTIALGSNGYAAPEQCGLGKSCRQTDIYGIGMVMYSMVTGKTVLTGLEPFVEESYNSNLEKDFKRIIQKCIRNEIHDRYYSIEELREEIIKYLNNAKVDNTMLLSKTSMIKDMDPKIKPYGKEKKHSLKKAIPLSLVVGTAILAVIYIPYNNSKKNNDIDLTNKPSINDAIKVDKIEEKPKTVEEKPKAIEEKSKVTEQPVNNTVNKAINKESDAKKNSDSKDTYDKKNKGKAHGKKKKKKD